MTAPEIVNHMAKWLEGRMKLNLTKFGNSLNQEYNIKAVEDAEILEYLHRLKEVGNAEEADNKGIS